MTVAAMYYRYLVICFVTLLLPACLTVETKEYHIRLKTDQSGEATIRFLNILSEADDTLDISDDDFRQLVEFYVEGTQLEKENPGFRNVKKRLYEENDMLVGEVTFDFDSLSAIRIFKYNAESPYMYFVGSPLSSEQLIETDGTYGPDWMPAVFWQKDVREMFVKTKVVSEASHRRSLLKNFKEWQERIPPEPRLKKQ